MKKQSNNGLDIDSVITKCVANPRHTKKLSDEDLIAVTKHMNSAYRSGNQLISDSIYDHYYVGEIYRRNPDNPMLHDNTLF